MNRTVLLRLEEIEGPEVSGAGGGAEPPMRGLRPESILGDVRVLAGVAR